AAAVAAGAVAGRLRGAGLLLGRLREGAGERRLLLRAVRAAVRAADADAVDAEAGAAGAGRADRAGAAVRGDRVRRVRDQAPAAQPEGHRLQPDRVVL